MSPSCTVARASSSSVSARRARRATLATSAAEMRSDTRRSLRLVLGGGQTRKCDLRADTVAMDRPDRVRRATDDREDRHPLVDAQAGDLVRRVDAQTLDPEAADPVAGDVDRHQAAAR